VHSNLETLAVTEREEMPFLDGENNNDHLKVLSSEMDPAEIRLIDRSS
jgi:hypothetical protein